MGRLTAIVVVLALLLFGGIFVVGTLGGGDESADATVEKYEPVVTVNDRTLDEATDGEGVQKCVGSGPSPGHYGVSGSIVVGRSAGDAGPREAAFRTTVTLADGPTVAARNFTLEPGESERILPLFQADNDGRYAVGDDATVELRAVHGGETVLNETATVTARRSGELDCEDAAG